MIKLALGEENARRDRRSRRRRARPATASAAAGAIEAIFTTLAIHEGVLPPTINYEVRRTPSATSTTSRTRRAKADVKIAINNSFGFGGHNACVVIRSHE